MFTVDVKVFSLFEKKLFVLLQQVFKWEKENITILSVMASNYISEGEIESENDNSYCTSQQNAMLFTTSLYTAEQQIKASAKKKTAMHY